MDEAMRCGRPPALTPAKKDLVKRMFEAAMRTTPEIADLFKVSAKTIRRVV